MKRVLSMVAAALLCISLLVPFSVSAAASASLNGPATIRQGDTITLAFNLNGSGIFGASGTLSYDSTQLQLTGTKQVVASPWAVEFNGNNFVAYDNNLSNPINKNTKLFTATFKVKAAAGTGVKVSYTNVTSSDGSKDTAIGTVSYSQTVAAPASGNNTLAALTVSNATVSPAFSADTVSYTATVPFSVSKLDVKATAADAKAKVTVSSPTLTPGSVTAVKITVTAENGSTKVYTIKVTREQDPNYVASGNASLAGIAVKDFLLSPAFKAGVTQYVVWLPYETESISISGTAADKKASVEVVGGDKLAAGQDNPVKVICKAEDGTTKVYTVTVKRAAAHDGSVEELPQEPVQPQEPSEPVDTVPAGGLAWWWLIVAGVAGLAVGLTVGLIVKKK